MSIQFHKINDVHFVVSVLKTDR